MSHSHSAADRRAAQAVIGHHAQLAAELDRRTDELRDAATHGDAARVLRHRDDLVAWLHDELLPHAKAEETALYPAAGDRSEASLLVRGMLDEHQLITKLVGELADATRPVDVAATAHALAALFAAHLAKENNLIVPLLVDAADVSLATLLDGMHDLLGSGDSTDGGCGGGGCGCGGEQE